MSMLNQRFLLRIVPIGIVLIIIWLLLSNRPLQTDNVDVVKFEHAKSLIDKLTGINSNFKCGKGCDRIFRDVFKSLTSGYRHCLIEQLERKNASVTLESAVSTCLGNTLWRLLDVKEFPNRDDIKQAILPPADIMATGEFAKCTEITLGVGRDIEAELSLRRAQPHCKFYGADPIKTSGNIFQKIGPYFEIAVDGKGGVVNARVLLEDDQYHMKQVKAVALLDFLLNYVNVTKVDYVLMDNEGPEYRLFPQLLTGGIIESNGISICQISAEMHRPFENFGVNQKMYTDLIRSILTNSSFLPIWYADPDLSIGVPHDRSFYINVGDPYCVGKYFRSKWCGNFEYYKVKEDE